MDARTKWALQGLEVAEAKADRVIERLLTVEQIASHTGWPEQHVANLLETLDIQAHGMVLFRFPGLSKRARAEVLREIAPEMVPAEGA